MFAGIDEQGTWAHFSKRDGQTGDWEFVPEWWLAPLETRLAIQRELAHSQMFHAMIEDCRVKAT